MVNKKVDRIFSTPPLSWTPPMKKKTERKSKNYKNDSRSITKGTKGKDQP